MKLSHCFCLIVGIPTFTGCATDPATFKLALDAQMNVKPTLSLKCPSGCEAEYTDPRDRQNVKLPTSGYDAYIATLNTAGNILGAAVVPAAFAVTATEGFKALKGSGQVTTTTTNTDNSNRSVTTNTDTSNRSTSTSTTDSSNRSVNTATTTTSTATTTTTSATDSYNTTTTSNSNNPVTTTTTNQNPVTTTTTTNPTTNPPVCAIDGTGSLVCQ